MNSAKRTTNKYASDKDTKAAKSDLKNEFRKGKGKRIPKGYKRDEMGTGSNDIKWHAKSPQLLHDAAAIPWSWATGKPIKRLLPGRGSSVTPVNVDYILPGIEVIRTVLTPGVGSKGTDPINVAAQALYTDIRRDLKSANQYEGSDVIIYLLAVSEIIAFISWCTRLYGTLMEFSFSNRYMPNALIKAQGVDPNSLKQHPAEFRARLNQCIAKASQIWIPKGFDFLTRARWEYANYYSEGENIKDQIYMLAPALFRKYTYDETRDYAGALEPFFYVDGMHGNTYHTWEDLIAALDEMIDALVGDTDFQNIAGDLFNRYGAGGVETFTLIPEYAVVQPVFSIEVLEQFQNSRCLTPVHYIYYNETEENRKKFFTVSQDETNNILVIPKVSTLEVNSAGNLGYMSVIDAYEPILNVHDAPSDEKTMLISRMTNVITNVMYDNTERKYTFTMDVSAEWVIGYEFISFMGEAYDTLTMFASGSTLPYIGAADFDESYVAAKSAFHYSPLFFRMSGNSGAGLTTPLPFAYGEQDIVAPISPVQLADLNRVDLLSLFAVPDVGSVVK